MARISEKSTKAEILAAYKASEEARKASRVETTKQVEEAKKEALALAAAEQTVGSIDDIQNVVSGALASLVDLNAQYANLQEAYAIKAEQLKDIHGF